MIEFLLTLITICAIISCGAIVNSWLYSRQTARIAIAHMETMGTSFLAGYEALNQLLLNLEGRVKVLEDHMLEAHHGRDESTGTS